MLCFCSLVVTLESTTCIFILSKSKAYQHLTLLPGNTKASEHIHSLYLPPHLWVIIVGFFFFLKRKPTNGFFLNSNILFIYLFLYLFLAVLGLHFCVRAFSSCGKQGPLFIAVRGPLHYRGLSCCGAQAPDAQAQ